MISALISYVAIFVEDRMTSLMQFDIGKLYNQASGKDCRQKYLKEFKERSYKVWVDVEQMHCGIYDQMAEGVASAFSTVPLVSEAYTASPNCELELKQAQKIGKAKVPVKIESHHPPETSWLSLIFSDHCY